MHELTLVIPTYNRPEHLARLLEYYREKTSLSSVLILDSSEPDISARNARLASEYGERFRHVIFPSTLPFASKLKEGLGLVGTPYCAFCADDDVIFLSGLGDALDYLRAHPDYVCVDGIYLHFFRSDQDIQLRIEYARKGIDAGHPGARVFRLYQKYQSLFYGVFRTSDLRDIFAGVCRNPSLHFQELFQATAALLIGKSYRLPVFYSGRQQCEAAEPTRDKWQTSYWFADDRVEFMEHYVSYRSELWEFYTTHGAEPRLDKDAFYKSMDLAHAVFLVTGFSPAYFYSVLQFQWPEDPFTEVDPIGDDVCNQLDGSFVRVWGVRFAGNLVRWLKRASAYRETSSLNELNSIVSSQCRTSWNCSLAPDLQWMVRDKNFRHAYVELCRYLDRP
jgi:glycosyltransferase domain-containing protein